MPVRSMGCDYGAQPASTALWSYCRCFHKLAVNLFSLNEVVSSMNLWFDQLQDIEIHTEVSLPNRTTLTVNVKAGKKKKNTLRALQDTYPLLHEYAP